MKSILTKIHVLSLLCALPALANDVGLHNSSAQPTGAKTITPAIVREINRTFANECAPSQNPTYTEPEGFKAALGGLSPGFAVVNALKVKYGIVAKGEVKAIITHSPIHGRVDKVGQDNQSFPAISVDEYQYTPDKAFLGDDKVAFEVTVNGQKFSISYIVKVVNGGFGTACFDDDQPV